MIRQNSIMHTSAKLKPLYCIPERDKGAMVWVALTLTEKVTTM